MTAGTHLAFAGLVGVLLQGAGQPLTPDLAASIAVGSLLPDVDTGSSGLGKFVRPLSGLLERRFGHRTITHSLLGLGLLALLLAPIWWLHPGAAAYLVAGAASHVLLDTANVTGVPLLWPSRLQFWLLGSRSLRLPYGSPVEATLAVALGLGAVALWPLSAQGFEPSFHRWLGTPAGLVEDYLAWRDTSEVFARVSGFNTVTQERVDTEMRVIDAIDKEGALLEDEGGRAVAVGRAEGVVVQVNRASARRGAPIVSRQYRLELGGRSVHDLVSSLPRARRVWVTADLLLSLPVQVPPEPVGYTPRLRVRDVKGLRLEVRSAPPAELRPYANAYIESGSAVVRAEFAPGDGEAEAAPSLDGRLPARRSHLVAISSLPTLAGLVVSEGDTVREGQPLARYINDSALETRRVWVRQSVSLMASSKLELERLAARHKRDRAQLERKVREAQAGVATLEMLVNVGAEPRAKLAEAKRRVRELEASLLESLSVYTSERARLEQQQRTARLTAEGAKAAENAALEQQWFRSPLGGLVSQVRVRGITAKGVDVELTILEEERGTR